MFQLIDNTEVRSFSTGNCTNELNAYLDPFGNQSVIRTTQSTAGNFLTIVTTMFLGVDVTSRNIVFSARVRNVLNVNSVILAIEAAGTGLSFGATRQVIFTNSWSLIEANVIATSHDGGAIQVFLGVENPVGTENVIESFGWAVTVDSLNSVYLEPEYNFKFDDKKIEDKHRSAIGRQEIFKWGDYDSAKFDVMYVSSGTRTVINSYWDTNAELLFVQSGQLEVRSVHITNKNTPINQFVLPYNNLYQGTIELETF